MFEVKTLHTQRLELKKVSLKNLNDFVEWHSQKEYYTYLPISSRSKEECKKYLKDKVKGYKTNKVLLWGIFFNDKLIGSVNISQISSTHKCCEIGWGLSPKFQKQGFAYEAVSELIRYIFEDFAMNKINIVFWDGNTASKNLAEKLGFVNEGRERQARYKNNQFIDAIWYGLLKSEWQEKHMGQNE